MTYHWRFAVVTSLGLALSGCGSNGVANPDGVDDDTPWEEVLDQDTTVPDVPLCGDMRLTPELTRPNLLLLVDKSGSMKDPISDGSPRPKLDDTKEALTELLDQGQDEIRFGYLPYPGGSGCEPGRVSVDCDDDSASAIQNQVNRLSASGGTPTGPALDVAFDYAPLHDDSRQNFVVLMTDGMPTCPNGDGREENEADNQAAISAVRDLHSGAIDTFVIGIGEDLNASNPTVLNELAKAGGRPRSGSVSYYQANSVGQLTAAFSAIADAVFGCTFTLSPTPEAPDQLWMTFDGQLVVRDSSHQDGWDYNVGQNQITAYGAACEMLQSGAVDAVEIFMGCAPDDPVDPEPEV